MEHNPLAASTQATTPPLASGVARFLIKAGSAEFEHAFIRFVFASGIVVYFAFYTLRLAGPVGNWTESEQVLAVVLIGFWLLAIGILAATYFWPAKRAAWRAIGMLADVGFATSYLWIADANGVWLIPVYLFIIFGNGFRYGQRYLFGTQVLSIAGLIAAGLYVAYWQQHSTELMALVVTLAVVPLYVSTLLRRIVQSHAHTKAALKECLERHAA